MKQVAFDVVPLWLLAVLVCAASALALEGGYRFGRWRNASVSGEKEAPVGAMVGSILALFAFILAFTFGTAATRFEARREAVLAEANAIGTTYLRARLLRNEQHRNESIRLLREYADVRVNAVKDGNVQDTIARSEVLHEALWVQAAKAAESDPGPITALYLQSLNETIDLHANRVHVGLRNRIPLSIWIGLYSLALLTMASVGYQAGLSATRRSPAMVGLVLAFSGVLFLIADLDRGRDGFLVVSQQALVDVQKSMNP